MGCSMNYGDLPLGRHGGSVVPKRMQPRPEWHGHGSPPPSTRNSTIRRRVHHLSGPSPIAASAAYFGHGPSPGPSVPPSEVGSSGMDIRIRIRFRIVGDELMTFHYPHQQPQQQQYPRSSASPPPLPQSPALSTSTLSPPPPGQGEGEKAAMLGRDEATVGSGVIVHQDAGKAAEEERSGGEEIPPTCDSLPFGERR
ncbi:hypothetical protein D9756_000026 [Leucocoprinus leucothites]|uniref:Uncharacterized protein n=1 Tax=Leucocoprinus leucothites TaxID=201217 RepID=A0A8H5GFD9_9AGAR|nr:hypothetical protein D9756_000026 [Leucoagaricus leucothites]